MARILILAGTTEATELAALLVAGRHNVVSSLAGITSSPVERAGEVRRGGFGGPMGLARFLEEDGIDVLVDATHPFAAVMPFNAARAASSTGRAHCRLLRPPWIPDAGDRWQCVPDVAAAVAAVDDSGASRVFLAVGRQSAGAFASCSRASMVIRTIEPLAEEVPGAVVIHARGPFGLADELDLLRAHDVEVMVIKNAGGSATSAKLEAARRLGVLVVVIDRPPHPDVLTFAGTDEVVRWCELAT